MTTSDGTVLGRTKIVDHGSPADRWNLVLLSDGYQAGQMAQYASDAQNFVNSLLATPPFDEMAPGINVYRVDVTSTDSGADDPMTCGGSGATAATYFDASFCSGNPPIRRLLKVTNATAVAVANAQVPQWHAILVIVNSPIYGGSGGTPATFSLAPSASEIGIHELGHTAFGLADEYEYWVGCGAETDRNNHPAVEPGEPNVTINSDRATIKWHDLVLAATPMPTTNNANCAVCDPQPSPVAGGTVGAFEGAHYYHCDAYRPEFDCKMRTLNVPFCAVCRRRIRQTLSPYLPNPFDLFEIWDLLAERIRRRIDWVSDPSPIDILRLIERRRGQPAEPAAGDDLTSVLSRIDQMATGELRATLLDVQAQIARLELAAELLQAKLGQR